MSAERRVRSAVALALALTACSGSGAPDAGPPDATACTLEEIAVREPIESASGLRAVDLEFLFGGRGVGQAGMGVDALDDGSLMAWDTRSPSSVVHLSVDGEIRSVRRGPFGELAADGEVVFRAYDGASAVGTGDPVLFSFGVFSARTGEDIAVAESFPLPSICDGVGPYSPHVSAGRFLTIRNSCGAEGMVAERWEEREGVLAVVSGPFAMPEADSGGVNRSAFTDGAGGVFFLGILTDGPNRLVVTHWDGDGEPVQSDPIGPVGTTTDFGAGAPYPDGTFAAAVNHVIDGFTTTVVARVDRDARQLWTWQSPRGYASGPFYPAIAVAGADDLIVVLVRPAEGRTVYVMRLDGMGRQRWPEPRALPWPSSPVHSMKAGVLARVMSTGLQGSGHFPTRRARPGSAMSSRALWLRALPVKASARCRCTKH